MTLKQIKDEIHNIKEIDLPLHSSGEDYDQLKTAIDRLENIVNGYMPPTCQSCKDRYGALDEQEHTYWSCNRIMSPVHRIRFYTHGYNMLSCIYHSDYERKENEPTR